MERIIVYFSDIIGTILSNSNIEEDYQQFSYLLSDIKKNEQVDKIIFSLISTDDKDFVSDIQNIIHPFITSTVTYGKQFFQNGYYTESGIVQKKYSSKAEVITEYVKELKNNYEIISIYYADDVEMYHTMLSFLAKSNSWKQQLHSIIPTGKTGLAEVNQLLENDIRLRFHTRK